MNIREKLSKMMYGRYGVDALSKGILTLTVVIVIILFAFPNRILTIVSSVLILLFYMRIFSRNFPKRQQENLKYMNIINRFKYQWSKIGYRFKENKTHHIYHCSSCKQKIRVPRGKGKISIRCPKCGNEFIKRS